MFKKPFQVKNKTCLRSSDKRKLRAELVSTFPVLESTPENVLDALVPLKEGKSEGILVGQVCAIKFMAHTGASGLLYTVDGQPMFIRLDTRLYPTVYALWKQPNLLGHYVTHGGVMARLLEGADLMLPGIYRPIMEDVDFNVGDPVSVVLKQCAIPLAIGTSLVSSRQLKSPDFQLKGKGVEIMHHYMDELWASGDQSEPPISILEESDEEKEEEDVKDIQASTSNMSLVDSIEACQESIACQESVPSPASAPSQESITPAQMDILFETALFTAIALKIPPNEPKLFPLSCSLFYSNFILPCRPANTLLDIKLSTHKKLIKFMKFMEKKGILKLKERKEDTFVMSIDHKHPLILGFIPPRFIAADVQESTSLAPEQTRKTVKQSVEIEHFYKPIGDVLALLREMGVERQVVFNHLISSTTELILTQGQIRTYLNTYIKEKNLVEKTQPTRVQMDMYIKCLSSKEEKMLDTLPRDQLVDRFIKKCQPCYCITLPGKEAILKKGQPPKIHIQVKLRSGNKKITTITGFEPFDMDAQVLSHELKTMCASSTSITLLANKTQPGSEVMVQGDKVKECCQLLQETYGIPFTTSGDGKKAVFKSKFIEISYGKGTK